LRTVAGREAALSASNAALLDATFLCAKYLKKLAQTFFVQQCWLTHFKQQLLTTNETGHFY